MKKKQGVIHKFMYSQKTAPYVFVLPFLLDISALQHANHEFSEYKTGDNGMGGF